MTERFSHFWLQQSTKRDLATIEIQCLRWNAVSTESNESGSTELCEMFYSFQLVEMVQKSTSSWMI